MHSNPAFSQAVLVEGAHKRLIIGGQNAVDGAGNIVGAGDLEQQTEQVLKNLLTLLEEAGAKAEDVVRWNVYLVQGQDPRVAFGVFQKVLQTTGPPPTVTVLQVAGLAHPGFLLEINGEAVMAG